MEFYFRYPKGSRGQTADNCLHYKFHVQILRWDEKPKYVFDFCFLINALQSNALRETIVLWKSECSTRFPPVFLSKVYSVTSKRLHDSNAQLFEKQFQPRFALTTSLLTKNAESWSVRSRLHACGKIYIKLG